jgi:hypothetical protein
VQSLASDEDRRLLEHHESFVRQMESELTSPQAQVAVENIPQLSLGVKNDNDNMPQISKMQIDLLVNTLVNDMARVATLQFTKSVGQARMRWLGIEEGHHELSHDPDLNEVSQDKLTRINKWFCEQMLYLVERLATTPDPGADGTLLDNTVVIWTNELGKGNSHTLNDIPFVLVGNGLDFTMGRSLRYDKQPHNRLLMALAHAMGHHIESFGNPSLSADGVLPGLTV